jgi:hypothetical protein
MGLKTHCVQEYPDPVGVLHLAFKNAAEVLKSAFVDHHFVTGLEVVGRFYKTVTSYSRSNQIDDLVFERSRLVVKSDYTVDPPGKPDAVIGFIEPEASEDITWEQGPGNAAYLTAEFVALIYSHPRTQSLHSPSLQIDGSAVFLFGMSMDHVPAKSIFFRA